jgi:hypothetical protein
MENAIKIAAAIIERLPRDQGCSPETTSGQAGVSFIPIGIDRIALEQADAFELHHARFRPRPG